MHHIDQAGLPLPPQLAMDFRYMGVLPPFVYAHTTPTELQGLHMGYASDREHWRCCGLGLRPNTFW